MDLLKLISSSTSLNSSCLCNTPAARVDGKHRGHITLLIFAIGLFISVLSLVCRQHTLLLCMSSDEYATCKKRAVCLEESLMLQV